MVERTERIESSIASIPAGRVMSYGDVAEHAGVGSARSVGRLLAMQGGGLPWHRVLHADGTCAPHLQDEQLARLAAEGVPIRGVRVQMALARWDGRPRDDPEQPPDTNPLG